MNHETYVRLRVIGAEIREDALASNHAKFAELDLAKAAGFLFSCIHHGEGRGGITVGDKRRYADQLRRLADRLEK